MLNIYNMQHKSCVSCSVPYVHLFVLVLCAGALGLSGCAQTKPSRNPEFVLPVEKSVQYNLKPGDEISIDVFREPDLSGTFRIESSGVIRHPLFGSVTIAGLNPTEAQEEVRKLLAARYLVNPRVIVRVTSSQAHRIVILGEVESPGIVPMPFEESLTLMQAIAQAGGFTDLAKINNVTIARNGEEGTEEIRVRVSRIIEGRDQDIVLQPNDIITVPQSFF